MQNTNKFEAHYHEGKSWIFSDLKTFSDTFKQMVEKDGRDFILFEINEQGKREFIKRFK